MISQNGALTELIKSGARVLEPACGPCIGMGQAPPSGGISLRTFNRNFKGRSGTLDAQLYLVSPEIAAASALKGVITNPRELGKPVTIETPKRFIIDDGMIIFPSDNPDSVEIVRGPNIQPPPKGRPLPSALSGKVLIKLGDNITTDDITPAGSWLKYRSNVPKYSEAAFCNIDPDFHKRAKETANGIIVGGINYGQGSSREHAALIPMYLGIKVVLAKSFARIHHANLVNFGIVPLVFVNQEDYEFIEKDDSMDLGLIRNSVLSKRDFEIKDVTKNKKISVRHELSDRAIEVLLSGGLLNYTVENF
jgi:aconitate hydratase